MATRYFNLEWDTVRRKLFDRGAQSLKQIGPGCYTIRARDLMDLLWICLYLRRCDRWYFRGQSDSRWGIGIQHRIDELNLNEGAREQPSSRLTVLLEQFKKRCMEFPRLQHVREDDEWRWEFYAQHYRLVTRLLDWTTNPLVAAYFAVSNYPFKKTTTPNSDDSSSDHLNGAVWALSVGSSRFKNWTDLKELPPDRLTRIGDGGAVGDPLHTCRWWFIDPPPITERLVRQSGKFTFHTDSGLTIKCREGEQLEKTNEALKSPDLFADELLIRIEVPFNREEEPCNLKDEIRQQLGIMNVHFGSLFPDAQGVAEFVNNEWSDIALPQPQRH